MYAHHAEKDGSVAGLVWSNLTARMWTRLENVIVSPECVPITQRKMEKQGGWK